MPDQLTGSAQSNVAAPDMMKAAQVAEVLQISMRTLYRWLSAGIAPAPDFKRGKVLRWRRERVERWIAGDGVEA